MAFGGRKGELVAVIGCGTNHLFWRNEGLKPCHTSVSFASIFATKQTTNAVNAKLTPITNKAG
ncbi:hypothetical protein HMPREF6745_1262 [Prevotella sp. oral taxon 472 str. F0295]|nr:hypothetical protein HMPREF6745_1262 [Prevotella sp. oral taxon 472 str. F0295]